MNFSSYPFDEQSCYFQFGSMTLTADEIVYNGDWVFNPGTKVTKTFKNHLKIFTTVACTIKVL
jgi:Neurotransmitter-gated ion-channel ligand binding domain